ncbi:MAG: sulfite oxidase [Desulfobacterales bacterium]
MRIMSQRPLNAETPVEGLRTWITPNEIFFDRNQGAIPDTPIDLAEWSLTISGAVQRGLQITFDQIAKMPKTVVADTLECSGNGRSLLEKKARGNPWTIGGVGNAEWGGVWLGDLLKQAEPTAQARHVAFEGFDRPLGKAGIKFIRSIPLAKAQSSTLLAYEMNGEPLPLKHGYPLRGLALGWTGANCVKWLKTITLLENPYEGFFMDQVYRRFQKGETPGSGEVVTGLKVKSIITDPLKDARLPLGPVPICGAAYAGETGIDSVAVSLDNGKTWHAAVFTTPRTPYAWRHWRYDWRPREKGAHTILARATDADGNRQPMSAHWNVLGYENNGVREHGLPVTII